MKQELPVLLLTGYLGSGKTTLVNKILSNKKGIRFAVIVNDIGEVNIDADLIQKGGIVGQKDESLVALQNGCICCTLKMDLVEQLNDIMRLQKFDYIVIEASGICEPAPIAQTICSMPSMLPPNSLQGLPVLDCIVTVVDALRLQSEFGCGENLTKKNLDEDDLENLVIQQIEFCNMILLNKASEVTPQELNRIKQIIKAIQPKAKIVECDYCDVDLDTIINTKMFDFDDVATSAAWIQGVESEVKEEEEEHHHHHHDEEEEEHEHCCHHHHHDEEEKHEHGPNCTCGCHGHHHHHHVKYGIETFVYFRRRPFNQPKFAQVINKWRTKVIRSKGFLWFDDDRIRAYIFEQCGKQIQLEDDGLWVDAEDVEIRKQIIAANPELLEEWDDKYGDRMIRLVFIGKGLDKKALIAELDAALSE